MFREWKPNRRQKYVPGKKKIPENGWPSQRVAGV